jgi:hypothetical protein
MAGGPGAQVSEVGEQFFAQSYAEARGKFMAAAEAAGLDVQSHRHPMLGRDGEVLAMDVARFGAGRRAGRAHRQQRCHGVEGFCGSGVQGALLADAGFHRAAQAAGRGRAVRARAQPLRLFVVAARHARKRRPQPQLAGLHRSRCPPTPSTTASPTCCCRPPGRPAPTTKPHWPPMPGSMASAPCRRR